MSKFSLILKISAYTASLFSSVVFADGDRMLWPPTYLQPQSWVEIETSTTPKSPSSYEDFCSAGKQIRALRETLSISLPPSGSGTPKDVAARKRSEQFNHMRDIAKNWFQLGPRPGRMKIHDSHTLFIPPDCKKQKHEECSVWGVAFERQSCFDKGPSCKRVTNIPSPSQALEYRAELWHKYFEIYTTVKESPSSDGSTLNFEVSLDLNLACKYARPIDTLTTN